MERSPFLTLESLTDYLTTMVGEAETA
jgi:hypothetical protein